MQHQRIVDEMEMLSEIAAQILDDRWWQSDAVAHRVYDRLLAATVWASALPAAGGEVAPTTAGDLSQLLQELEALIERSEDERLRSVMEAQITGRLNLFLLSSGVAFGSSGILFSR